MNKTLILPIKKKWFDMICSGYKKEEYRTISRYWATRLGMLAGYYKGHKYVELRNGYGKKVPAATFKLRLISVGMPKDEWTDKPNEVCFVIGIGDRVT